MRENNEIDIDLHIELLDPNKNVVSSSDNKILIDHPENRRVRTRIKGNTFTFTVLGQYLLKINIRENDKLKEVAEIPIDIYFKSHTEKEIVK
jgi:hypothetical protein